MSESPSAVTTTTPRRRRVGRKRTKFAVPWHFPRPVKALWREASEEDRARAHRAAATVIEAWLGRIPTEEAARRLEVPRLRFWQMSQQAVAGMLAGLLVQPKMRGKARMALPPEEDPVRLRAEVMALRRELEGARGLIAILREMPAHREAQGPLREGGHGAGGGRSAGTNARRAAPGDRAAPPAGAVTAAGKPQGPRAGA
jgi:hypothetical protein